MDNKKMNSTGVEDHILDVEHLSMYFTTKNRGKKSTVKAVDDVSFYVKRGETFGLVGEVRLRKNNDRPHDYSAV